MRFAVITANFYGDLAERLIAGARRAFSEAGVGEGDVGLYEVPGAFELPLAAKKAALTGEYGGVVCLGAVIEGDTDHYDYVCTEAARGIQDVSLDTGVPCSFGVITCESMDQALERSGGSKRDQGYNAAKTVLAMADLLQKLQSSGNA